MAKQNCCKFPFIIGNLIALLGIYLLTAGLIQQYALITVLKSSVFWGLFLIITAMVYPLSTIKK
jgi:predicted cobalt transporter CbtA